MESSKVITCNITYREEPGDKANVHMYIVCACILTCVYVFQVTVFLLQLKNADYFSQFVTEDFEQYINRKRSDHSYGNNLEMQAMAEMYNRAIEVHQYSIGQCYCMYTRTHVCLMCIVSSA